MKYNEWTANKNDAGWKSQIRKDINQAIKAVSSYEEFLALMKAKGYEMKGTEISENGGKYITFPACWKSTVLSVEVLSHWAKTLRNNGSKNG